MIRPGPLEVGFVVAVVVAAGVITGLVVFVVKQFNKKKTTELKKDDEYLGIAKERYAKGELSQEQYEQIKKEFFQH